MRQFGMEGGIEKDLPNLMVGLELGGLRVSDSGWLPECISHSMSSSNIPHR